MEKESARLAIAELVAEFRDYRKNNSIRNEDELSDKFVRPLFRLLGWSGKADYSLEEHVAGKFADIGYYIDGVPAFYVETKDVDKDIHDKEYMSQAINYSYLRGVTWAVLTDFETLMVFNAEWAERDPNESKFIELGFDDYTSEDGFDDLWLLSKASFMASPRLIDKRAERYNRKDKKLPVSEGLLAELLEWRRRLFREIRVQATTLWATDTHKVDNAIQKFFDRLIFIRTMEDRRIEEPRLSALLRQTASRKNPKPLFPELLTMFRELDDIYNSNLFAEHRLDFLEVHDPTLLEEIIKGLYKGQKGFVQYDFEAISADVLGAVYEQYLGFKAQYDGEEDTSKNLKRKLQGIYYTPQYVVRYIVQQTLGRLLQDGRDPLTLRVLDPACGSGAFLIEAFDVLKRAYLQQHPSMSPAEMTHNILTKNLYGVDLDDQAVEVTRLNLSIRGAVTRQKLPNLSHIKHGNSLIADDAIAGEHLGFDWAMRFPDVMNEGGFDAVIGNPPYGAKFSDMQKKYLRDKYNATGTSDTYELFMIKGCELLKAEGKMGTIIPSSWMTGDNYTPSRKFILNNYNPEVAIALPFDVFKSAYIDTAILVFTPIKPKPEDCIIYYYPKKEKISEIKDNDGLKVPVQKIRDDKKVRFSELFARDYESILSKLISTKLTFGKWFRIQRGVQPYSSSKHTDEQRKNKFLHADYKKSAQHLPELQGKELSRYNVLPERTSYLEYSDRLASTRNVENFQGKRIVLRRLLTRQFRLQASMVEKTMISTDNVLSVAPINDNADIPLSLAIMNSKLISWYYAKISLVAQKDDFPQVHISALKQLPIPKLDLSQPAEKAQHDALVAQVERMLALQAEHQTLSEQVDERRHEVAEQIEQVDKTIDGMVYQLYALTAEEIAIVEG